MGQVGVDQAKGGPFSIFGDMDGQEADHWGIRACAHNFQSYQKYDGCDTIGKIIARHAPPSDNNDTQAYVNFVCGKLGVDPATTVFLKEDPDLTMKLLKVVFMEEDSRDPYPDEFIAAAVAAA